MSNWIKCSERMPEAKLEHVEYLVYEILNDRVQHDYWNVPDECCSFEPFWNHYGGYVTHWQPLPEPPEE